MSSLTVTVEDHDELSWAVEGDDGVRGHGRELGGLAGLDDDRSFAEGEADAAVEHVEPVVARVNPRFRRLRSRTGADGPDT